MPSGNPKTIPNDQISPFYDELVAWVESQLTSGQRAIAAQTVVYQLQDGVELFSDYRAQLVKEMIEDNSLTQAKAAEVLGVSLETLKRLLKRGYAPRKAGGVVNNRAIVKRKWLRVKREWGHTAADRKANGYPGNYARRPKDG